MNEKNGFYHEIFFKDGQMHIQIRSKNFEGMSELMSKIKEWIE